MSLEIHLTEGPNVHGLPEERTPLYVGHSNRGKDLVWRVIEGRRIGTPKSYRLHIGSHGAPLEEAKITRFEHSERETILDYTWREIQGRLIILNTSSTGIDNYGGVDEKVDTVYNFFGDGKTDMRPNGCDEYYKD